MKKPLYLIAFVLVVAGGLIMAGGRLAQMTVHDQLADQRIYFPKTEAEGLFPDLQKYAGQQVDNGAKAKAFADKYIKRHLEKTGGGKTYSEISADFMKNPADTKLAQLRETMFMGETLRGMLLNAWGWGLIGLISFYAGLGLVVGGLLLAVWVISGERIMAKINKIAAEYYK